MIVDNLNALHLVCEELSLCKLSNISSAAVNMPAALFSHNAGIAITQRAICGFFTMDR